LKVSARRGIFFGSFITVMVAAAAIFIVNVLFLAGTTPDEYKGNAQNQHYRE